MNLDDLLARLTALPGYDNQLAHLQIAEARDPAYAEPSRPLPAGISEALAAQGVDRLFSHQAEALNRARNGENVLLVTPTASGKTLCYNLPVSEALLHDSSATALYLFPTKALAQDQKERLRRVLPQDFIETFDGDTPPSMRRKIKSDARAVLTNPDMLHLGILPYHLSWSRFLMNLRYVVIDEVHVYRGVFGSHMAHVLRRLDRLCDQWGSHPQYFLASATSGNPLEHAITLAGRPLTLVEASGAPAGRRAFAMWNPDAVDAEVTPASSYVAQATWLFAALIREGVRTILFTRARQLAEWITVYLAEYLSPQELERVKVYRGGYLPSERRAIERQLFSGDLTGVVATTALELGVDIGGLDASILLGFPGTMASVWQQAGRAGRGTGDSLAVFIPSLDVMDRFLLSHPDYFFDRPYERAVIDPENPYILVGHVACAAFERPIGDDDFSRWGPMFRGLVDLLHDEGRLTTGGGRWHYAGEGYPARHVSLRSTAEDAFLLVVDGQNHAVGTIDAAAAPVQAHPGAVYLHAGESYVVSGYDETKRVITLRPEPVDYFTEPAVQRDVEIVSAEYSRTLGPFTLRFGELRVRSQVYAFRRRHVVSRVTLGQEPLDFQPSFLETMGFWLEFPSDIAIQTAGKGVKMAGAVHALEHALVGLLPLFASTDRWDIGGTSTALHPSLGRPAIFVYDGYSGGVGFAEQGFEQFDMLVRRALDTVEGCSCEEGCPSCIQSPKCGHWNNPLDKQGAVLLLRMMVDECAAQQETTQVRGLSLRST